MVSAPHEAMHRVFQEYPSLLSGLSDVLGLELPPVASAELLTVDLTETEPLERRVDTLLRIRTESDGPFLLVVEAQGKKDPGKTASWPYYVTYLNNKYRLPVLLLVICQDHATAAWAARPLTIGLPQWPTVTTRPLVAGPHNMPVITDPAEAQEDLVLATLAAITHAGDPAIGDILKALSTALRIEREDNKREDVVDPIIELISQGLGNRPAKQLWRNLVAVDLSFYKSDIAEEIRDEGRVNAYGAAILTVLEQRGINVPADARQRITECGDLETLQTWLARAATALSAAEIFGDE